MQKTYEEERQAKNVFIFYLNYFLIFLSLSSVHVIQTRSAIALLKLLIVDKLNHYWKLDSLSPHIHFTASLRRHREHCV